ncbi:MAG: hypothetical protein JO104_01875 [Candidatus Eremiobacteraeota bacterium]|nr:hypothetical protein [Candidatus Eremiobacteraeota bacterium]
MMYLRWVPALVAVPAMAIVMSLAAGVPVWGLGAIVTGGAVQLAPVYVAVIFGALLGRITIDTGIARSIVDLAAEYGGERPLALSLGLCAIVALLFTSLSGLGGVIMVGSIVLPIMMTAGVPRTIAATLFLMGFALGYIFNIANWTFYTKYFGVSPGQLERYAIVLAVLDAIALVLYACISFRRARGYATWVVRPDSADERRRVPAVALLTPFLPLVFYYALHVEAAPAFVVAAVFGAIVTRPSEAVQRLVAAGVRGVEDVAPAVLLFMGIGMLLVATQEPQFSAVLQPLVAGGWLRNPLGYVVLFGIASPLVLYRGPLNPFGVGIAIFTALLAAHVLPAVVLVAAIMAVVQVQNVCDPTNTANVWIANFTGVEIDTITKRTLPYQTAVAIAATVAVVVASPVLFGQRAFASILPAASAAEPLPGFYAPASARDRIGVDDDGTTLGDAAADETARALVTPWQTLRVREDPNASDCSHKRYAAYVYVTTSTFALTEGMDLDVGLRLEDCGGWVVDEWHDHQVFAHPPSADDARALAEQGAFRLRGWTLAQSMRSRNLFALGVAARTGDPPAYFYAFFKTADGNLRAYVRGGGPAYAAALRSGDVIETIDGAPWWQLGTYQSERLAYDGKPHTFEISRNGRTATVRLVQPFAL